VASSPFRLKVTVVAVADSEFTKSVLIALSECLPDRADAVRLDIDADDPDGAVVGVHTTTPGLLIGRRGTTAAEICRRLWGATGVPGLRFKVYDVDEPPGLSGVREPRVRVPPQSGGQVAIKAASYE
jgi:hypothetical protein